MKGNQYVAHYFRECHFEKFLVPESDIKGFDKLNKEINTTKERSDKWYDLTDEFNNKFWQYKCEGELYDTIFFIKK